MHSGLLYPYLSKITVNSFVDCATSKLIAEPIEENVVFGSQIMVPDMLAQYIQKRVGNRNGIVAAVFRVVELHYFCGKVYVPDLCRSHRLRAHSGRQQEDT